MSAAAFQLLRTLALQLRLSETRASVRGQYMVHAAGNMSTCFPTGDGCEHSRIMIDNSACIRRLSSLIAVGPGVCGPSNHVWSGLHSPNLGGGGLCCSQGSLWVT